MDIQLTIFNKPKKRAYMSNTTERIIKMKRLVYKYKHVRCRDIEEFALAIKPFEDIRHQFQVGHLPTLRYISFHRDLVEPTQKWIEGFIKAAEEMKDSYDNHPFQE